MCVYIYDKESTSSDTRTIPEPPTHTRIPPPPQIHTITGGPSIPTLASLFRPARETLVRQLPGFASHREREALRYFLDWATEVGVCVWMDMYVCIYICACVCLFLVCVNTFIRRIITIYIYAPTHPHTQTNQLVKHRSAAAAGHDDAGGKGKGKAGKAAAAAAASSSSGKKRKRPADGEGSGGEGLEEEEEGDGGMTAHSRLRQEVGGWDASEDGIERPFYSNWPPPYEN